MIYSSYKNLKPSREPDFLIGPNKDDPYMRRWWLIPRNTEFNIYYHEVLHDDDDRALHDHPWSSISLCTKGRMAEVLPSGESRVVKEGDVVFRPPTDAHRLELIHGEPCETLFITGPRIREWGFHCPKGFVEWTDFVDPNNPGSPGRGCGEMS